MLDTILTISIIILTIYIGIVPSFKEVKYAHKFSAWGTSLIGTAMLVILLTIYKSFNDSRLKSLDNQLLIDSIGVKFNQSLKSYGLHYNKVSGNISVGKPLITMNTDPLYRKQETGLFRIEYDIKNIGTATAYKLKHEIICIVKINKNYKIINDVEETMNESVFIPVGGIYSFYTNSDSFNKTDMIIFIKFSYCSDSTLKNNKQQYLRKIYKGSNSNSGGLFFDISSNEYSALKRNLVSIGKW